ncbi:MULTISPECIES: hypothetical protein [Stutzerimonas stutzeri subgroup]|uniref:hypothetical protein n=1 Tax=Stutzerimonas stutzeri subgroup TaxID=578833 RepID=UPI00244A78D2|nr:MULTISPECIES: hypothetical protein [Stutzerimonas stutzeri subgroup]MDH0157354.1 hypothetical protein [Stutzerimonas stutzeri]
MSLRDEILEGAAEALAVVEEIGETITLTLEQAGGYDPVTGSVTPGQTLTQTAKAILDNYTLQSSGTQYADGSMILRDDKKIFFGAAGLEWPPTLETTITAAGQVWKVVAVSTLNPTGEVLAYEVQGRR